MIDTPKRKGPRPHLTPEQAKEVRAAWYDRQAKWTVTSLARCFGVSVTVINNAIERKGAYKDT